MKNLLLAMGFVVSFAWTASASVTVLTFDDLVDPSGIGTVPTSYAGLTFNGWFFVNSPPIPLVPHASAPTSLYPSNPYTLPEIVSASPIDVLSVYMSGDFCNPFEFNVTLLGYLGSSLVHSSTITIPEGCVTMPRFILNFTDIDRFVVLPPSRIMVLDNFEYQQSLPNAPPVANAGSNRSTQAIGIVSLDGSGSSDPDGDYPLTYQWTLVSAPEGSTATLTDATIVNPQFVADEVGDYVVGLIVTDSHGLASSPAFTTISTYNTAPVAAAGDDQLVKVIGSTVHLNGSASYDEDGDPISYSWTFQSTPPDSTSTLSNAGTASPSFVADIHGTYVVGLIVTDALGAVSQNDTVTISFDNVKPVADAGGNQSVVQGEVVLLSGTASTDANLDSLIYHWSLVSKPDGSLADISDTSSATPHFPTDLPGTYVLSLVVNDGFDNSDPANISIVAISYQDATLVEIAETVASVNSLPATVLTNKNMRNALTNKINAALLLLDHGNYAEALDKFQSDILQKTNGCAYQGKPDSNDWITDCAAQEQVYPYVMDAIGYLKEIIE